MNIPKFLIIVFFFVFIPESLANAMTDRGCFAVPFVFGFGLSSVR